MIGTEFSGEVARKVLRNHGAYRETVRKLYPHRVEVNHDK